MIVCCLLGPLLAGAQWSSRAAVLPENHYGLKTAAKANRRRMISFCAAGAARTSESKSEKRGPIMLLEGYTKRIFRAECNPQFESLHCIASLDQDVSDALPYLNAVLGGFEYLKNPPAVVFRSRGRSDHRSRPRDRDQRPKRRGGSGQNSGMAETRDQPGLGAAGGYHAQHRGCAQTPGHRNSQSCCPAPTAANAESRPAWFSLRGRPKELKAPRTARRSPGRPNSAWRNILAGLISKRDAPRLFLTSRTWLPKALYHETH